MGPDLGYVSVVSCTDRFEPGMDPAALLVDLITKVIGPTGS